MEGLNVEVGGPVDNGGGGAAQPAVTLVPETRSGRKRSGDFASRMLELNNAGDAPPPRTRTEDPGAVKRGVGPREVVDQRALEQEQLDGGDPELEQQALPEEGDEQQALDAEYKPLFDAMRESIASGAPMDTALIAEMPVEMTLHDGRKRTITFAELQKGYMRQSQHTEVMTQARQLQAKAEHIIGLHQQHQQQYLDPDQIIRSIQSMSPQHANAFDEAVYRRADQLLKFRNLSPEQKQLIQMRNQAQAEIAQERQRIAQERAELQRSQQPQQDQVTAHFEQQLAQLLPRALKKHGVRDIPAARQEFMRAVQENFKPEQGVTPELVDAAAQSAREVLEYYAELVAKEGQQRPANNNGQPLAARRLSGGAGNGVQRATGGQKRPSEFGKRFGQGW